MLGPQICRRIHAVGQGFAGSIRHQALRPAVVGVIHARAAAAEQNGLGVAVLFHGVVEIQMVLGQVGEHAHLILHAVHPVQHQCVGGNLHDHMGAAGIPHPGKQTLDIEGLRCGALRGNDFLADHVLVGADEAHFGAQRLLQNGLEQISGSGFAVGSGDAHHGHMVGGVAKPVGAHHGQCPAGVRHLDIGNFHSRGACRSCLADERMAVHRKARHGHKQVALLRSTGIIADVGDLHFHVRRGRQHSQSLQ